MSTVNKSFSANYVANARGYVWEVPSAPSGVFWTAISAALGARNFASVTTPPASIIGAPVPNPSYLSFDGGVNYFETALDETEALTFIVVARNTDLLSSAANQPLLVGTHENGAPIVGAGIYITSTSFKAIYCVDAGGGTPALLTLTVAQAKAVSDVWNTYAFIIRPGVEAALHNLTTGTSSIVAETRARILAPRKIRIGGGYAGITGNSDIAFCGMMPVGMTLAQVTTAAAQPRLFLSEQRSIAA